MTNPQRSVKHEGHMDPDFRLSIMIHDCSRMMRTLFDHSLRPRGITRSQWLALGQLSRAKGKGMTQTQLAQRIEMGKVAVGATIDRLEKAGFVERRDDLADRRINRIFVTPAGRKILSEMAAVARELDSRIFRDVSREQIEAGEAVLGQIKLNLRAELGADYSADVD